MLAPFARNINLPPGWVADDGTIVWAGHISPAYQDCRALINFLKNEHLSNMKVVLSRDEDLVQFLRANGSIYPLWENKKRIVEEAVKRYIQGEGKLSLPKLKSVKFHQEDLHLTFEGSLLKIDQDEFKRKLRQQMAEMFADMNTGVQSQRESLFSKPHMAEDALRSIEEAQYMVLEQEVSLREGSIVAVLAGVLNIMVRRLPVVGWLPIILALTHELVIVSGGGQTIITWRPRGCSIL